VLFDKVYACVKGIILITSESDDINIIDAVKELGLHIDIPLSNVNVIQVRRADRIYQLYSTGSKKHIENFHIWLEDFSLLDDCLEEFNYLKVDILSLNNHNTNKNIKEYADGTTLIKNKQGAWVVASNKDTLEDFKTALYGGIFGIHKFKEKKYLDGFLFLVTGGLFCLGYLEEIILYWCDCKKDEFGNYYKPLDKETKKLFVIPQIVMVLVNILVCAVLFWLLRTLI
jgi:hypothetical protein